MKRALIPALCVASACVALVLAAPAVAAGPTQKSVKQAADRAEVAIDRALAAAQRGRPARASAGLNRAQRLARNATRRANRITNRRGPRAGARANRVAATGVDAGVDSLAEAITSLRPGAQARAVDALGNLANLRGLLVERLTELAGQLPEPARTKVLEAIAAIHDGAELTAILDALADPAVGDAVREQLLDVFNRISGQLGEVLGNLEELIGMLPPPAAAAVGMAIGQIQASLEMVFELLDGLLSGGLPGLGGLPGIGGGLPGLPVVCDLFNGLPLPIPLPGLCR